MDDSSDTLHLDPVFILTDSSLDAPDSSLDAVNSDNSIESIQNPIASDIPEDIPIEEVPLRVVASYTTIPTRYDVLKRSIETMRAQTHKLDAIYLTIPKVAARLNKPYPPIPDDLAALCTVVNIDTDYGPLTKIYGALVSEADPNTVIISCDDDVFFAPNHVEVMLSHHKTHPKSVICGTGALIGRGLFFISIVSTVEPFHSWRGFTGFTVGEEGRKVDLIFGVAGVLYTRGLLPPNELLHEELLKHSLADDAIFHNDDVLISGYLSRQGIERRIFLDIPTINHANGEDALSADIFKMISRLNTAIQKVKDIGYFTTMEELSLQETPAARGLFILLIIVIIIILIVCLFIMR
jgi:hypothetical protein